MLYLVDQPAELPISLIAAKAHLNVDHSNDDDVISSMIATAVAHLDGPGGLLGRALVTQRWELRLSRFPERTLEIPLPICREIVSITYLDRDEAEQTLPLGDIRVTGLGGDEPAQLWPTLSAPWPATADHPEAVRIRYDAGFGAAADVPAALKSAILQHVASLYQTREASYVGPARVETVPHGYLELIAPFQQWRF